MFHVQRSFAVFFRVQRLFAVLAPTSVRRNQPSSIVTNMASEPARPVIELSDSPRTRRQQITAALLEVLQGSDDNSEGATSSSSSEFGSLQDDSLREMLAAFIHMTNRDIRDLQNRVTQLETQLALRDLQNRVTQLETQPAQE